MCRLVIADGLNIASNSGLDRFFYVFSRHRETELDNLADSEFQSRLTSNGFQKSTRRQHNKYIFSYQYREVNPQKQPPLVHLSGTMRTLEKVAGVVLFVHRILVIARATDPLEPLYPCH
jgi:hypothetical protein